MKKSIFLSTAIFAIFLFLDSNAQSVDDFIVIVNNDVSEGSLNSAELRRIYFGFTPKWKGQRKIRISYERIEDQSFWKLLSTTKSDFNRFWDKRERSDNGLKPVVLSNAESVIDYVSNTEGAIGIIQKSSFEKIGNECKRIDLIY
ncbi:MAG: hypothetical protein RIM99_12635 [Cyclobacteriaceae bacterium]